MQRLLLLHWLLLLLRCEVWDVCGCWLRCGRGHLSIASFKHTIIVILFIVDIWHCCCCCCCCWSRCCSCVRSSAVGISLHAVEQAQNKMRQQAEAAELPREA
jgi:hypothetical protein